MSVRSARPRPPGRSSVESRAAAELLGLTSYGHLRQSAELRRAVPLIEWPAPSCPVGLQRLQQHGGGGISVTYGRPSWLGNQSIAASGRRRCRPWPVHRTSTSFRSAASASSSPPTVIVLEDIERWCRRRSCARRSSVGKIRRRDRASERQVVEYGDRRRVQPKSRIQTSSVIQQTSVRGRPVAFSQCSRRPISSSGDIRRSANDSPVVADISDESGQRVTRRYQQTTRPGDIHPAGITPIGLFANLAPGDQVRRLSQTL